MLSQSDYDQIYQGLTHQARKVLSAVPKSEAWGITPIMNELHRLNTGVRDFRHVEGCLDSLRQSGLVKEATKGEFVQVPVKPRKVHSMAKINELQMAEIVPAPPSPPLKTISNVAQALRSLADEIDMAVLEVEEQLQNAEERAVKLKQLQELLRGLRE